MTPLQTLTKYFGYSSFRPNQLKVINSILSKQDTLCIMPTGGGKSLCFQIPALILRGTSLVISPLISLMTDQVQALRAKNIPATCLHGGLSQPEIFEKITQIKQGYFKLVYLAPERLQSAQLQQACQQAQISMIVIDEAHCASMWGHDFRPSYQSIKNFTNYLQPRPILAAFTATATPQVKTDMVNLLNLQQPKIFTASFYRPNIFLNLKICKTETDKQIQLIKVLKKHQGQSGIIYCSTRHQAEELAKLINHFNFRQQLSATKVKFYHGGMIHDKRATVQEAFIKDQTQLMTATNAFGMGVDKPNIRFTIHYQLPANLENFYQESGRAGRDRKPADAYLLFCHNDIKIQLGFIRASHGTQPVKQNKLKKLQTLVDFCLEPSCLTQKILRYYGEIKEAENSLLLCKNCSNCQKILRPNQNHNIVNRKKSDVNQKIINHRKTQKLIELLKPQSLLELEKIGGVGPGMLKYSSY